MFDKDCVVGAWSELFTDKMNASVLIVCRVIKVTWRENYVSMCKLVWKVYVECEWMCIIWFGSDDDKNVWFDVIIKASDQHFYDYMISYKLIRVMDYVNDILIVW